MRSIQVYFYIAYIANLRINCSLRLLADLKIAAPGVGLTTLYNSLSPTLVLQQTQP